MGCWNHKKTKLGYFMLVFVANFCYMFSHVHPIDGKPIVASFKTTQLALAKHEGAVKTIGSEDGDIIDCVDIYKQPAFDHPLLKNHTIQMKPSSYLRGMKSETSFVQVWHKSGDECPKGTIPIVRAKTHNVPTRTIAFVPQRNNLSQSQPGAATNHEYAQVSVTNGNYFGATARLNLWHPKTFDGEFSLAQIWVYAGSGDQLNTVEDGWITNSGETDTRIFIYWTADGYVKTGCYNLVCPGFVQTDNKVALGGITKPASQYGGQQFDISITISKDKKSGNWWLRMQDIDVGYWPGSLFTTLSNRADFINWGGEIVNKQSQGGGRHTSTEMGSGHFAGEGFGKASYFRNVGYIDESGSVRDAELGDLAAHATNPACYDVQVISLKNDWGSHFYFGGPGFSDTCK